MKSNVVEHLRGCSLCRAEMDLATVLANELNCFGEIQPPVQLKSELLALETRQLTECKKVSYMLGMLVDGELSRHECVVVKRHLHICAACRNELAVVHTMIESTRELESITPPTILRTRILDEVSRHTTGEPVFQLHRGLLSSMFHNRMTWHYALGAFAMAAVFLSSIYQATPPSSAVRKPYAVLAPVVRSQPKPPSVAPTNIYFVALRKPVIPVRLRILFATVSKQPTNSLQTKLPTPPIRPLRNRNKMPIWNTVIDTTSETPSYQPATNYFAETKTNDNSSKLAVISAPDESAKLEMRRKSLEHAVALLKTKNNVVELARQTKLAAVEQKDFHKPVEVALIGFKF